MKAIEVFDHKLYEGPRKHGGDSVGEGNGTCAHSLSYYSSSVVYASLCIFQVPKCSFAIYRPMRIRDGWN